MSEAAAADLITRILEFAGYPIPQEKYGDIPFLKDYLGKRYTSPQLLHKISGPIFGYQEKAYNEYLLLQDRIKNNQVLITQEDKQNPYIYTDISKVPSINPTILYTFTKAFRENGIGLAKKHQLEIIKVIGGKFNPNIPSFSDKKDVKNSPVSKAGNYFYKEDKVSDIARNIIGSVWKIYKYGVALDLVSSNPIWRKGTWPEKDNFNIPLHTYILKFISLSEIELFHTSLDSNGNYIKYTGDYISFDRNDKTTFILNLRSNDLNFLMTLSFIVRLDSNYDICTGQIQEVGDYLISELVLLQQVKSLPIYPEILDFKKSEIEIPRIIWQILRVKAEGKGFSHAPTMMCSNYEELSYYYTHIHSESDSGYN